MAPPEGDAVGEIIIKKIDVDWAVVEGVQLTDIAKGPGHYPGTPLPGQIGNAAIAGHRTTHGAPFYRVDELTVGDKIVVKTLAGTYTYVVTQKPFAVDPTDYGVVANTPDAELTLTSCNPRYSAAQRIIIKARLVRHLSAKVHKPPTHINGKKIAPPPRKALATGLQGESNSVTPVDRLGRDRRDRRRALVVGVPPLAAPAHVDRRRDPVPDRAVPVLRVSGTRTPQRVLAVVPTSL